MHAHAGTWAADPAPCSFDSGMSTGGPESDPWTKRVACASPLLVTAPATGPLVNGAVVCPGRGLLHVALGLDGPQNLHASGECAAQYAATVSCFCSEPDLVPQRQHVVDAYACQHPLATTRRGVQTSARCPMTLDLVLDRGLDVALGSALHRKMMHTRPEVFAALATPDPRQASAPKGNGRVGAMSLGRVGRTPRPVPRVEPAFRASPPARGHKPSVNPRRHRDRSRFSTSSTSCVRITTGPTLPITQRTHANIRTCRVPGRGSSFGGCYRRPRPFLGVAGGPKPWRLLLVSVRLPSDGAGEVMTLYVAETGA